LIELRSIGAEEPVRQLLVQELQARRRPFWLRNWSTRAFFERRRRRELSARRHLRVGLEGSPAKRRRLREQGRLVWQSSSSPRMRARGSMPFCGWRRAAGKDADAALACNALESEFFVSAATAATPAGA
jgi:hypothetical protein